MKKSSCSIIGCNRKHYGKGYCQRHHRNWYRHGKATTEREEAQSVLRRGSVALTHGVVAIVDECDYDSVIEHNWHAIRRETTWYARRWDGVWMHNFIMGNRKGLIIDHINHNGIDNRRANLRLCTHAENCRNKRKTRGTSKYKGVSWNPRKMQWEVRIGHNNKMLWIGYFGEECDAATAYNVAAQLFFGDFACLNPV